MAHHIFRSVAQTALAHLWVLLGGRVVLVLENAVWPVRVSTVLLLASFLALFVTSAESFLDHRGRNFGPRLPAEEIGFALGRYGGRALMNDMRAPPFGLIPLPWARGERLFER